MTDLQITPGHIPLPIRNSPAKIQLNRISHVYHSHPDLDSFDAFARDFGFVEDSRDEENQIIYYRGYGPDKCVYVARKSPNGRSHFGGVAFTAQTEEDFLKASKLATATTAAEPYTGPGGGRIVTVESPSGTKVHVLWGVKERPVPSRAETQTEVHKGGYNTALQKTRKGEFQRFKPGPAMIHKLGHVGYVTAMFDEDVAFYTQAFNFVPSDVLYEEDSATGTQTDALTFMHLDHGQEYVDHHTVFLSRAPQDFSGKHKMHHCSFEVEDFDTQLLGHEYLLRKKWTPIWGVGRHVLGSQIFDYWKDPSGFAIEHYADGDLVNEDNETGRERSEGAASMYIWGPLRPEAGVA
ncbi:Glyoxalase/Bleomycin resistance protein/Dihydroxybiphenyl dioxygenase [Aspergillus lucknowensis]|uniref:Glyoxalase/Bleomycin resistance protein/Dihydroxybiphenyl dioxygenase n=1 Tax=Aspergillus lucknowensis TaxID=176173 RepID=A0ABR4LCJ5_9EURO